MTLFAPVRAGQDDEVAVEALARRIAQEIGRQGVRDHGLEAAALYRARRLRERHFPQHLFAEPAWDVLLDLFIAGREGRDISVSSACIAADVPTTTALRYLQWLTDQGLVDRVPHATDARSIFVRISAGGSRAMIAYLDDLARR